MFEYGHLLFLSSQDEALLIFYSRLYRPVHALCRTSSLDFLQPSVPDSLPQIHWQPLGNLKKKKMSPPFSINGFKPLGPSIYLQDSRQPSAGVTLPVGSPDLVLLTSWTGASARHVAKYTRSYNEMYPNTPIMVITTVISDLTLRSAKTKAAILAPAVNYLRTHHCTSSILLHAFSDGGSHKAVCLAQAYVASTSKRLPIAASVLDSTPGTAKYTANVAAYRRSLPRSPFIRAIGLPMGAIVLALTWVLFCVFIGYDENRISKTRRALNDETLWDVKGAPRTYVFSQADDLISWQDIEQHAVDAVEKLGMTSMLLRYKGSGHCAHAREDEECYWNAVRRTWEARDVEAGLTFGEKC